MADYKDYYDDTTPPSRPGCGHRRTRSQKQQIQEAAKSLARDDFQLRGTEHYDEGPAGEIPPQAVETTALTGVVLPDSTRGAIDFSDDVSILAEVPPRSAVLREADKLVNGDRQKDYGPPSENFQRIADLWNVQLKGLLAPGKKFTPLDVALAMAQVKMGRAVESPKRDTFVDAAGYLGLAYEMSLLDG